MTSAVTIVGVKPLSIAALGLFLGACKTELTGGPDAGCSTDAAPEPQTGEGAYVFGCPGGESECEVLDYTFQGEDTEHNETEDRTWQFLHMDCSIERNGPETELVAWIANQMPGTIGDTGRERIDVTAVVVDGEVDRYSLRIDETSETWFVDTEKLLDAQPACDRFELDFTSPDSFDLEFDCPYLWSKFQTYIRNVEGGRVAIDGCRC